MKNLTYRVIALIVATISCMILCILQQPTPMVIGCGVFLFAYIWLLMGDPK